jgi:predicted RNase H-like nuclease (RuvC/YqgF family)
MVFLTLISCSFFVFQGLILIKALKAQKDAEDESYQIALGNLRSEFISLRNEALEKDRILLSLVEKLKSSEASLAAQVEAQKAEVEELKRKVAKATEKFEVEAVKHEICEIERSRVQKNANELRASKEKCYEISFECSKKLKDSFAKVGAYSSEQKFISGDLDGVVQWISGEAEAFDEILNDRGDFCAFAGAWGPRRS